MSYQVATITVFVKMLFLLSTYLHLTDYYLLPQLNIIWVIYKILEISFLSCQTSRPC